MRSMLRSAPVLVVVAFAACSKDQPTAPVTPTHVPSGSATHSTYTTLGTYSIPIPPNNTLGGAQPVANTGIFVPAGTYYRVRVNGTVTVSANPEYVQAYGTPWNKMGTYGPFGTIDGELIVQLKARNTDGSGTGPIGFLNPQYNSASGPDSARSDVVYASKAIEVQAGRTGIGGVKSDNCCFWSIGMFALVASQNVTVEQVTDVAHVVANPVAVHPNQQVTFTASRDDGGNLIVYNWHWQPDAGQPGNATNLCGGGNPCLMNVPGSGTMLVYTNVGNPTAHVTVYTNFALSADKTNIVRGDTVTFTPLTDGVPLKAARWRWVADSTPDSPSCASANPACKTPINASGTMWAYTATSGGDSAHVHITARDKYELRAAPSLIAAGAVVTFRPYLNGQPTPAARWRWVPQGAEAAWDSIAGCANGAIECHRATFVSGTMWAYRSTAAGADSAPAAVTISVDCAGGGSLARRSRPAAARTTSRVRTRPSTPQPLAASAGTGTCSDSVLTQSDVGTDTLPKVTLRVVADVGTAMYPTPSDSLYPVGTVVPYHITPDAGYGDVIAAIDDSIPQPGWWHSDLSGTIAVDDTHTLQAGARPAVSRTGLVAEYAGRLEQLSTDTIPPPEAYRRFLQWSIAESALRGAVFDSLMRVARYVAFDPMTEDSTAMLQFDQRLAGYWFELDGDTIAMHPPGYYSRLAGVASIRPRARPSKLSTTLARPRPKVILVNGIWTVEDNVVKLEQSVLTPLVRRMWFGDSVDVTHWYNPTFKTQWAHWDEKHKCAFRVISRLTLAVGVISPTTGFALLGAYAHCLNTRALNAVLQRDLVECATDVFDLKVAGTQYFPNPEFVDSLTKDSQALHALGKPTIFVAHSQGNLMLASAFDRPAFDPSVNPTATVCTAALSLAPPISAQTFRQYSWLHWSGYRLKYDILNNLGLNSDVDVVPAPISAAADRFAALYPILWLTPPVQLYWAARSHFIENYLVDTVDEFRGRLVLLVNTCYNSMPQ